MLRMIVLILLAETMESESLSWAEHFVFDTNGYQVEVH